MKKVTPGQPLRIPATDYNAFVDAAMAEKRRRYDGGIGVPPPRQTQTIFIKNSSGGNLEAFNVLGIDGPLIPPSDNLDQFKYHPALDGSTPSLTDHRGKFVVLAEPIADGKIGRAFVDGLCVALVAVNSDDDEWAEVADGSSDALNSGSAGSARIVWRQGATSAEGPRLALVLLGIGISAGSGQYPFMLRMTGVNDEDIYDFLVTTAPLL